MKEKVLTTNGKLKKKYLDENCLFSKKKESYNLLFVTK